MEYARYPPIITFVGRPLASRKGLATFIDAIAILQTVNDLPPFQIWLIGGDVSEQRFLQAVSFAHPTLRSLAQASRWVSWGAVENVSLPEIYSRSLVVVVPSTFEQFGLVAVEAMACGCPVVASNVGGIRDTVIPGVTGELIPVDDAEALANVLASYIRNPHRREYQAANASLWAKRFSAATVYGAYFETVRNNSSQALPIEPEIEWRRLVIEDSLTECSQMLNQRIIRWEHSSGRSQVGARLTTETGEEYHVKLLLPRPSTHSIVLPLPPELRGPRSSAELVAKFEYFSESGLTPSLKASSRLTGIVITEWLPNAAEKELAALNAHGDLVERFASWGRRNTDTDALIADSVSALRDFADAQNHSTISRLDQTAARLNSQLLGGALRFHRIHPQVELFRILTLLERSVWILSPKVEARLKGILALLLGLSPVIVRDPRLCHGSLKTAHILKKEDGFVACDLDNAVYAVGPLDAVHWCVADRGLDSIDLRDTLTGIARFSSEPADFVLATCWLFTYLFYGLLDCIVRGKKTLCDGIFSSLLAAYECLFNHNLIRSE